MRHDMKYSAKIKLWFREAFIVFCQEFKLIKHDAGLIIFFGFLPIAYPIIYSLIYNPEVVRDVPMVVVDHDRTFRSRELAREMDATQGTWVIGYASDLNEARHAMNSQKCFGILEIPEGFERKLGRNEQAQAVMYCEMSLLLRYKALLMSATDVMQQMGAEVQLEDINTLMPLATTISNGEIVGIKNVSMGNITDGFDSFIMPGIVVLILHQSIILAMGMAGGAKRENTHLLGYNPINAMPSVSASMLGQMLCCLTIMLLPSIFLFHYVPLIFDFPMAGNFWEEYMFLLPMMIACVALGMVIQGVVWEREAIFVIWVITSVAILFLSGLTWPRYAMQPIWKLLGDIIPATWGMEGFIRMNTNGADLTQVRAPYYNLWLLAGTYTVLGYCVQRWVMRPSIRKRLAVHFRQEVDAGEIPVSAVAPQIMRESNVPEADPYRNNIK